MRPLCVYSYGVVLVVGVKKKSTVKSGLLVSAPPYAFTRVRCRFFFLCVIFIPCEYQTRLFQNGSAVKSQWVITP